MAPDAGGPSKFTIEFTCRSIRWTGFVWFWCNRWQRHVRTCAHEDEALLLARAKRDRVRVEGTLHLAGTKTMRCSGVRTGRNRTQAWPGEMHHVQKKSATVCVHGKIRVCRNGSGWERNRARSVQKESTPSTTHAPTESVEDKKKRYNDALQTYSKAPFEYRFDLGLYYHRIPNTGRGNLLVGSQPTAPNDIDYLKLEENVTVIFNTQQDKDMEYWGVDFRQIEERIKANQIQLVRIPFPDFDPEGLRVGLPRAVAKLNLLMECGETVYLHCTAGMGRSPAVAITWLYWFGEFDTLDDAYSYLTEIRPCGPNKDAIRFATCDLLNAIGTQEGFSMEDTVRKVDGCAHYDIPELTLEDKKAIQDFLCEHMAIKAVREEPALLEKFRCFCQTVMHQVTGE